MRNVRRAYGIRLTPALAQLFHAFAQEFQEQLEWARSKMSADTRVLALDYDVLMNGLRIIARREAQQDADHPVDSREFHELFIECCWAAGYCSPQYRKLRHVRVNTVSIDPEFMLARLFGLTTGIRGLDELFGGGLMLADNPWPRREGVDQDTAGAASMPGRTVLIKGGYGNGKSILALQLAAEVARKGGLAYLVLLEQSPLECQYTLESLRVLPRDADVRVVAGDDIREILQRPDPHRGAIVLQGGIKESYNHYLAALKDDARRLSAYPLRVLIVDPVNSVVRPARSPASLRAEMVETFNELKGQGTNLILVAEERVPELDLHFEENIADTVIRLSSEARHGYTQRVFEITKSRYQREQRGKHSFSIRPSEGIAIYPSPAAVSARLSARAIRPPNLKKPVIGIPVLDNIIRGPGGGGISAGDVVVIKGPDGTLKTQLGLVFLLAPDSHPGPGREASAQSLMVAPRDSKAGVQQQFDAPAIRAHWARSGGLFKNPEMVEVCDFPTRHADPGLILQRIEEYLIRGRIANRPIDRAVVDDVSFWDHSCPPVREDVQFATALIQLFRRHEVTCMLLCGDWERDGGEALVQRACTDSADCVIELDRWAHLHAVGRILRTRDMRHDRVSFSLGFGQTGFRVDPEPLLRFLPGGEVRDIPVRLFLHAESVAQRRYNQSVGLVLRAALTAQTVVEGHDRVLLRQILGMVGNSSTVDEVQILQLDEYQLPAVTEAEQTFICFEMAQFQTNGGGHRPAPSRRSTPAETAYSWGEFLPQLAASCTLQDNRRFFAVPYYANIGLLAYRDDAGLDPRVCQSWRGLADAGTAWERENKGVFFDFPKQASENYNCLFLEILSSLAPPPAGSCGLQSWLSMPEAREACLIFRQLGRRGYLLGERSFRRRCPDPASTLPERKRQRAAPNQGPVRRHIRKSYPEVAKGAVVWRHWYTTLNQMLAKMSLGRRQHVQVISLPDGKTIAGEWVLAVPAYTAAPEVALSVVRFLTSSDAEADRLQRGVGLPTRKSFYEVAPNRPATAATLVSPYFNLDPQELTRCVTGALRRSTLVGYRQFAPHLAYHLRRLLEFPESDNKTVDAAISGILDGLCTWFGTFHTAPPELSEMSDRADGDAQ
jgi:KaiC/GvpD/RAD55 family RecA-like ATPase